MAEADASDLNMHTRLTRMIGEPVEEIALVLNEPGVKEQLLRDSFTTHHVMCMAARNGDVNMLTALLDSGVDPDVTEPPPRDGPTALYDAIKKGKLAAYRVLRQAGAKLETFNPASNIYDEPIEVLRKYVCEACKSGSFNRPFFEEALSDILHQGESFYSKDGEALIDQILESSSGEAMVGAMRCGLFVDSVVDKGNWIYSRMRSWNQAQLGKAHDHMDDADMLFSRFVETGGMPDDVDPLQTLHDFASVGKLNDAMALEYWQGEAKQALRSELMAQLFPDEQALLLRELPSKLIDAAEIAGAQKPVKSWGVGVAV